MSEGTVRELLTHSEQAVVATVLAGLLEVVNTSLLKTDSASVMAEYMLQYVEATGLLGEVDA